VQRVHPAAKDVQFARELVAESECGVTEFLNRIDRYAALLLEDASRIVDGFGIGRRFVTQLNLQGDYRQHWPVIKWILRRVVAILRELRPRRPQEHLSPDHGFDVGDRNQITGRFGLRPWCGVLPQESQKKHRKRKKKTAVPHVREV
jgi:hypothetical protein